MCLQRFSSSPYSCRGCGAVTDGLTAPGRSPTESVLHLTRQWSGRVTAHAFCLFPRRVPVPRRSPLAFGINHTTTEQNMKGRGVTRAKHTRRGERNAHIISKPSTPSSYHHRAASRGEWGRHPDHTAHEDFAPWRQVRVCCDTVAWYNLSTINTVGARGQEGSNHPTPPNKAVERAGDSVRFFSSFQCRFPVPRRSPLAFGERIARTIRLVLHRG